MAVRVIFEEDIPWRQGSEYVKDGKTYHANSRFPIAHFDNGPWFGRARYDPGMRVESHWHPCNEVLYITSGELKVGDQVYKAGTALAIDEGTVYGPLIAGADGAEFLTIRDRQPGGIMKPEDVPPKGE